MNTGCFKCDKAQWDADGCTCEITGLLVGNAERGCEYRKDTELKPCPFCGSTKIKVDSKSVRAGYNGVDDIVYRATYSVRCNKCHARGGTVGGKVLSLENYPKEIRYALPSWATTWEEIKSKAIEAWNRRTENDT